MLIGSMHASRALAVGRTFTRPANASATPATVTLDQTELSGSRAPDLPGLAGTAAHTAGAAIGGASGLPVVIGHRGASGYLPEHTLASYIRAALQGADYIEPDLVPTKDGHLVARHENNIAETTDVADHPEFADRHTTKEIDGQNITGWFTEDFTLAELRTLKARGRTRAAQAHDGKFLIPTLEEVMGVAQAMSRATGRSIGIYPETKHPSYFASIGLPIEEKLVDQLRGSNLPVIIQSFEPGSLQKLSGMIDAPLAQLVDDSGSPADFAAKGDPRTYADLLTPEGLAEVASYADIVAPSKNLILPRDGDEVMSQRATGLIDEAHRHGLAVHAYTFGRDNGHLPAQLRTDADPENLGDMATEVKAFLAAGLDGLFTNHPDVAVAARDEFVG
ncbi:MAG: glycerophosphodiester phosphodiesterase [Vulcanimicrobiota bacterium]